MRPRLVQPCVAHPVRALRHPESNCSSCIGDLKTSKSKLRGANYPREKPKTRWFSWPNCRAASVQSLLFTEIHTPYILYAYAYTQLLHGEVTGVTQVSHTGVTQLSHTGVTGKTTATCRDHRGSYNCHTQESQADAQLLHGEVTGVTQREENKRIIIHHSNRDLLRQERHLSDLKLFQLEKQPTK